MAGMMKAAALVVFLCAGFVWTGQLLTDVSGVSGVSAGGDVGVERGEAVFFGKGKCYTCHSFGGRGSAVRCPNLGVFGDTFRQPIGVRAGERKAGEGFSAIEYVVESLYDPDAYVLSGFPKGLMPPVNRPPIGLDDDEIASAVLFLFAQSDVDVTSEMLEEMGTIQKKFAFLSGGSDEPPPAILLPSGDPRAGQVAYVGMMCLKCHKAEGVNFHLEGPQAEAGVGPALTSIGSIQGREYLIESILSPSAVVVADPPGIERGTRESYGSWDGFSKMPSFHIVMTVQQMLDIGAFLETLQGEESNAKLYP